MIFLVYKYENGKRYSSWWCWGFFLSLCSWKFCAPYLFIIWCGMVFLPFSGNFFFPFSTAIIFFSFLRFIIAGFSFPFRNCWLVRTHVWYIHSICCFCYFGVTIFFLFVCHSLVRHIILFLSSFNMNEFLIWFFFHLFLSHPKYGLFWCHYFSSIFQTNFSRFSIKLKGNADCFR